MAKNKPKNRPRQGRPGRHISIFCRSIGPGGSSVRFYPTKDGARCVWENEASDNENFPEEYVSFLSKEDLRYLLGEG